MRKLENKEVLAKNLRYYIDMSGKDDKDIAAVVGVAVSTFSEWLNAKKYPRIDKIQILADYFHISMCDLIEDRLDKVTVSTQRDILMSLAARVPENKIDLIIRLVQSVVEDAGKEG